MSLVLETGICSSPPLMSRMLLSSLRASKPFLSSHYVLYSIAHAYCMSGGLMDSTSNLGPVILPIMSAQARGKGQGEKRGSGAIGLWSLVFKPSNSLSRRIPPFDMSARSFSVHIHLTDVCMDAIRQSFHATKPPFCSLNTSKHLLHPSCPLLAITVVCIH